MTGRVFSILLALCLLTALSGGLTIVADREAASLYARGDYAGAAGIWGAARRFPVINRTAAFNSGAARYRMGQFSSAAADFAAAADGAPPETAFRALHNQGNSLIHLAGTRGAEREVQRYRAAAECYRRALKISPGSRATTENLRALERILAAGNEQPRHRPEQARASGERAARQASDSPETGGHAAAGAPPPSRHQRSETDPGGSGDGVRRRIGLNRQDAERMLIDRRGVSLLPSAMAAGGGASRQQPVEKEW